MTRAKKLDHCQGCRDNFYNGNNPMGIKECWGVKTARLVTRYQIGTWTKPDQPFAFTKVKVHQCFHADGEHYYEKLPSFVKPSEVGQ